MQFASWQFNVTMATLDDKILGEKLEYYCSSDEGGDSDDEDCSDKEGNKQVSETEALPPPATAGDSTSNTGPKGVIKDYQRFKQLETERRDEQEKERIALAHKLSLTCRSALDEEEDDPEFAELLNDPFLLEYAKQRMEEMLAKTTVNSNFGSLIHLRNGDDFLDAIDKEDKSIIVVLLVYEDSVPTCRTMVAGFEELSEIHINVKFCKILASSAGLSRNFRVDGVPAILVYKGGQLIGNFVQLREEFGVEFTANDISNYLIENGIDLELIPTQKGVR